MAGELVMSGDDRCLGRVPAALGGHEQARWHVFTAGGRPRAEPAPTPLQRRAETDIRPTQGPFRPATAAGGLAQVTSCPGGPCRTAPDRAGPRRTLARTAAGRRGGVSQ